MSPRPHRTDMLTFRATPEETRLITAKAERCGLSRSKYLRDLALGHSPKERPNFQAREAIYHLSRIGNNLNQLAHHANATKRIELERRIHRVLALNESLVRRLS